MQRKQQFCNWLLCIISHAAMAALAIATVCALTLVLTHSAQAQTFQVIHNFTGADGAVPEADLTLDAAGNLYGTTSAGGGGQGTVFQLKHWQRNWLLNNLVVFNGNNGAYPYGGVVFGPDGALYGTAGGGPGGYGVIYRLTPPATACKTALCPWVETILYEFAGGSDGASPTGKLTFDHAGNIYGTTYFGGAFGEGTVFALTPSHGVWTHSVLYSFAGGDDGQNPYSSSGVVFDDVGNLYGTTSAGGTGCGGIGCGTVYQLTRAGSGWKENLLYSFQGGTDGDSPWGVGVIFDQSGNLCGATSENGAGGAGTVYELTPTGGSWTFALIYSLGDGLGAVGPRASLTMDATGNLYGTTVYYGAYDFGSVFKLTHSDSGWTYTSLYDFTAGSDGGEPTSAVAMDASGNLYGMTYTGGTGGYGVVWEITP
jgi:uncharacterized repeat protein (TIGR03803 family)